MHVRVECPHCNRSVKAPQEYLGRVAKCPGCGEKFRLESLTTANPFSTPPVVATAPAAHVAKPEPGLAKRPAKTSNPSLRIFLLGGLAGATALALAAGALFWAFGGKDSVVASRSNQQAPPVSKPAHHADTSNLAADLDSPDTHPAEIPDPHPERRTKHESPKACFESYVEAMKNDDKPTMLACNTEHQQQIVVGMKAYSIQLIAFKSPLLPDQRDEVHSLFQDHGIGRVDIIGALQMASTPYGNIGDEKVMAVFGQIGASITDRLKFLQRADQFIESIEIDLPKSSDKLNALSDHSGGEETLYEVEYEINGDLAVAIITLPDGRIEELDFIRLRGGWLMGEDKPAYDPIPRLAGTTHPMSREFTLQQQLAITVLETIGVFGQSTIDDNTSPHKVGRAKFTCTNDRATDDLLEPLRELTFLHSVDLGGASLVTDRGIAPLSQCKSLRNLNLSGTQVTDRGLAFLSRMPELESLRISDTQVTDALVDQLRRHRKLEVLDVANTQVTEAAVKRFRATHPNCFVASGSAKR